MTFLNATNASSIPAAAELARTHDVAVVCAGTDSSEAEDRESLSLDAGCDDCAGFTQDALIDAVASANPKTVVALSVPGAVLTPWRSRVGAILAGFMLGQQYGNALADVLFGDVPPSGRLPLTFPSTENETRLTPAQW